MEEELFNIKSRFGEYPSYRVTKSGKVFSYRQGNILKPLSTVLDSSGYPIVKLYDDTNKRRTIAVHRLIADTFIPNPNNLECINHKDEDKTNNSVIATANLNDNTTLKVGEIVDLHIKADQPKGTFTIPSKAIIKNEKDDLIFINSPLFKSYSRVKESRKNINK